MDGGVDVWCGMDVGDGDDGTDVWCGVTRYIGPKPYAGV